MKPRFVALFAFMFAYLQTAGSDSFLERWIDSFVAANPRLFGGK